MTARGLIPIGTFPDPDTGEETPDILFTGVVTHLETDPDAPEDEPDCSAEVETADFTFRLLFRTEDEIKPGNVLYGFAWLFG